jgi:thymidylate kinase
MFQEILVNTARDVGWEIVRYAPWLNNRGQGRYFFIKNNDQLTTIHFDCYVPIYSKGINYIEEKTLSKNLFFFEKGFYVPVYGVEASILLFKDLFHDEKIKEKYRKRISECLEKDSKGFLETVKLMVGNENAKTITDMAKSGNWKQIEKMRSPLRRLLLKRGLLTGPFSQLYQLWRYIYTRLKEHFFEDLGIFIVLMGPDGSGKTTIAEKILASEGIKKLFQIKSYFHGRFANIPELKEYAFVFKKDSSNPALPCTESTAFSPQEAGFLRAIMYPLYYGLDAMLGHLQIRRVKAYYCITVADRYFYDYFIQKRYAKCPRWLISLIAMVIPKPDIVIYLNNNPEVISARKQDLPIEEIQRQVKICEKIIKQLPYGVTVETSSNIGDVVREIEKLILDKVRRKWKCSPGYKHICKVCPEI